MHPNALAALVEKVTAWARLIVHPVGHPTAAGKPILDDTEEFMGIGMHIEGMRAEREVVALLLNKHKWATKWSDKYLTNRLQELVQQVVERRDVTLLTVSMEKLIEEYDQFDKSYSVYVPLVGAELEAGSESIKIGDVILHNMRGNQGAEFKEKCRALLMKSSSPIQAKQRMFAQYEQTTFPHVIDRICAEYVAVGDPEKVSEIAIQEVRRVIDVLRYCILFLPPTDKKRILGIKGEVSDDALHQVHLGHNHESLRMTQSLVFEPVQLTSRFLDHMNKNEFRSLSDLLSKRPLTDFEAVILRAVHWLATAQSQFENENKLLNLVTCLETFLKPAKDDPISATIAEGIAILTATGLEQRKQRKARIKEFYGMRSRLTHEGHGTVLANDLYELTGIALSLTVQLIRRKDEFATQEQLRGWLDDERLRGSQ